MKIIQLIAVITMICSWSNIQAQLEKGNLLIGGNAGFSVQFVDGGSNSVNITASPNILSMVTDRAAVGGQLSVNHISNDGFSNTFLGIFPTGRLYIPGGSDNMAFFIDGRLGLQVYSFNFGNGSESRTAFAFGFGPGIAFFLSDDVSIDTGLSFNRIGGDIDQSSLNFVIGLQVFLNGDQGE